MLVGWAVDHSCFHLEEGGSSPAQPELTPEDYTQVLGFLLLQTRKQVMKLILESIPVHEM